MIEPFSQQTNRTALLFSHPDFFELKLIEIIQMELSLRFGSVFAD